MTRTDFSWVKVSAALRRRVAEQEQLAGEKGEAAAHLNKGQRASVLALAERIGEHGVVLADEVGMGKTRIAVELICAVNEAGGRAAIIAPPGWAPRSVSRPRGSRCRRCCCPMPSPIGAWGRVPGAGAGSWCPRFLRSGARQPQPGIRTVICTLANTMSGSPVPQSASSMYSGKIPGNPPAPG